jgi:acyl-CoA thioesterase-1
VAPSVRHALPLRVTVVLVLLVGAFTVLLVTRAVSGDVPRCERHAAQSSAREQQVRGTGERVVVIGDSYSVGILIDDPAQAWPSRLDGRVQVHGFSGSGFSTGASPCSGVSFAQRAERADLDDAALVVVQGGLNDFDQPEAAVRDGVRRLLDRVAGHPVVLVGPAAAPSRVEGAARVDALLAEEAERAGVPYVPMGDLDLPYLEDRLHLTAEGHAVFGDAVAARLPDPS